MTAIWALPPLLILAGLGGLVYLLRLIDEARSQLLDALVDIEQVRGRTRELKVEVGLAADDFASLHRR